MKRPFWIHQVAEYIVGLLLVAQGLQSPAPLAPSVAGGLVVINAAIVRGAPLSAFRLVSRSVHRVLDIVVLGIIVVLIVQPWIEVIPADRLIMGGIVVVLGFVWLNSNFAEKPPKAPRAAVVASGTAAPNDVGVGAGVGRKAGRLVGNGINAAKRYGKR
ncbi:MAG: hypothetical protein WD023_07975 [Ilumatobacteraceae bacterium]